MFFRSRVENGKDAASPRYTYTRMHQATPMIFDQKDNALLHLEVDDENNQVEPTYYVPIIPMALVNGGNGIGVGYSSLVPPHNPKDLITIIRVRLLNRGVEPQLIPWYRGFKGTITSSDVAGTKKIFFYT